MAAVNTSPDVVAFDLVSATFDFDFQLHVSVLALLKVDLENDWVAVGILLLSWRQSRIVTLPICCRHLGISEFRFPFLCPIRLH